LVGELIGMDVSQIGLLAERLRTQGEGLAGIVASIDNLMYQFGTHWNGPAEIEFLHSWQRIHRPAMIAVEASILGLTQSALNNAAVQDQTSSTQPGSAPGGRDTETSYVRMASSAETPIAGIWNRDKGWIGPLGVAIVPAAGSVVLEGDNGVHLSEDLYDHHWYAAYNQGSDLISVPIGLIKGPVGFLAGWDLIEINHAVAAGHAIDWSTLSWSTFSWSNLTAPGTFSSILQSERQGLQSLFWDEGTSALEGWVVGAAS
jgi:hypothetical protein